VRDLLELAVSWTTARGRDDGSQPRTLRVVLEPLVSHAVMFLALQYGTTVLYCTVLL